jgi:sugar-specific transcriptional regulator TrmB
MEEKIDRLEQHFKIYKSDAEELKSTVKNIETALIGSNLNGNKGIVNLLDEVDKRLNAMEKRQILYEEIFRGFKWSAGAIIGGVITFFIWFFTKDK